MARERERLLAGFQEAMLEIYTSARKLQPPYTPSEFLSMVNEYGGKGAADRLLAKPNPSSGFTELFLRGKHNLSLSVEYLVLTSPWRELFSEEQLAVARRRLLEVEFEPPPEDSLADSAETLIPEELPEGREYLEGASRQILVNAFERSAAARQKCIEVHGTACGICGFDFGAVYGPLADGLIHVHHLRPLSELGSGYVVDPVKDLRPVCPNCHAVIHLGGECRDLDVVRRLLEGRQRAQ